MAHRMSLACTAAILALAAAAPAGARPAAHNRGLEAEHQPVVSRTDFTLDVAGGPHGLATGEPQRLAGWFDGLVLGYGDTVTLVDPGGWRGDPAADAVGAVLSRYGMLLSADGPPVSVGHPAPGTIRVVVSRAVARVDGCPDWSRGNYSGFDNATASNFGCATSQNLAAMIADPQDLIEGQHAGPAGDARISVKAVTVWRDADPTGKGPLKAESSKSSGGQ